MSAAAAAGAAAGGAGSGGAQTTVPLVAAYLRQGAASWDWTSAERALLQPGTRKKNCNLIKCNVI